MRIDQIQIGKRHRHDMGDVKSLIDSIADIGLLHPVVITPGNELIAGERRLTACKALGWSEIPVTVVDLAEVARGEFAENAIRKDFLPSEIDAIRRALEPEIKSDAKDRMSEGGKGGKVSQASGEPERTRDKIGAFAGVSGRTVEKIAKVVDAAEQDPERFGHLVDEMDRTGRVNGAYIEVRREQKFDEIISAPQDLDTGKLYSVLYADPPWRYEHPPMGDSGRSIENHYPTMTLEEICALEPPAADDAVLYLWATAPKLAECFEVITAWGFTYRTCMVWVKDKIGMGYYARNRHEILLIARKGALPPPAPENRPDSVLEAVRGAHSAKPLEFYSMIETAYPGLGKLEMFARAGRDGWDSWGNQ